MSQHHQDQTGADRQSLPNLDFRASRLPDGITTFRTNVNRTKTKRWAEAKPGAYDGDDWGGYEYDYSDEQENDEAAAEAQHQVQPLSSGSRIEDESRVRPLSFSRGDEVIDTASPAEPSTATQVAGHSRTNSNNASLTPPELWIPSRSGKITRATVTSHESNGGSTSGPHSDEAALWSERRAGQEQQQQSQLPQQSSIRAVTDVGPELVDVPLEGTVQAPPDGAVHKPTRASSASPERPRTGSTSPTPVTPQRQVRLPGSTPSPRGTSSRPSSPSKLRQVYVPEPDSESEDEAPPSPSVQAEARAAAGTIVETKSEPAAAPVASHELLPLTLAGLDLGATKRIGAKEEGLSTSPQESSPGEDKLGSSIDEVQESGGGMNPKTAIIQRDLSSRVRQLEDKLTEQQPELRSIPSRSRVKGITDEWEKRSSASSPERPGSKGQPVSADESRPAVAAIVANLSNSAALESRESVPGAYPDSERSYSVGDIKGGNGADPVGLDGNGSRSGMPATLTALDNLSLSTGVEENRSGEQESPVTMSDVEARPAPLNITRGSPLRTMPVYLPPSKPAEYTPFGQGESFPPPSANEKNEGSEKSYKSCRSLQGGFRDAPEIQPVHQNPGEDFDAERKGYKPYSPPQNSYQTRPLGYQHDDEPAQTYQPAFLSSPENGPGLMRKFSWEGSPGESHNQQSPPPVGYERSPIQQEADRAFDEIMAATGTARDQLGGSEGGAGSPDQGTYSAMILSPIQEVSVVDDSRLDGQDEKGRAPVGALTPIFAEKEVAGVEGDNSATPSPPQRSEDRLSGFLGEDPQARAQALASSQSISTEGWPSGTPAVPASTVMTDDRAMPIPAVSANWFQSDNMRSVPDLALSVPQDGIASPEPQPGLSLKEVVERNIRNAGEAAKGQPPGQPLNQPLDQEREQQWTQQQDQQGRRAEEDHSEKQALPEQNQPRPAPVDPSKIPTFREIMAIPSLTARIETYNSSREQYKLMDSGLADWLAEKESDGVLALTPAASRAGGATSPLSVLAPTESTAGHRATSWGSIKGNSGRITSSLRGTLHMPRLGGPKPSSSSVAAEGDLLSHNQTSLSLVDNPVMANSRLQLEKGKEKGKVILSSATKGARDLFSRGKNRFRSSQDG